MSSAVSDDVEASRRSLSLGTWSVEAVVDDSEKMEIDDGIESSVAEANAVASDKNSVSTSEADVSAPEPEAKTRNDGSSKGVAARFSFSQQSSSSSSNKETTKIIPLSGINGNAVESQPILERAFSNETSNRDLESRTKFSTAGSSDRVARLPQQQTVADMLDAPDSGTADDTAPAPAPNNVPVADVPVAAAAPVPSPKAEPVSGRKTDDIDLPLKVQQIIAVPQAASSVSLVQASQVHIAVATPPVSQNNGSTRKKTNDAQSQAGAREQRPHDVAAPVVPYMAPSPAQKRASRRAGRAQQEEDSQDRFPEIQITDEEAAAFGYDRYGYGSGNQYYDYEDEETAQSQAESGRHNRQPNYGYEQAAQPQYAPPAQSQYAQPAQSQYTQPQYEQPAQAQSPQYELASARDPQYDQSQYSAPQQQATTGGSAATETNLDKQDGNGDKDYTDAIARVEGFLSLTRLPSYQSWIRGYRK